MDNNNNNNIELSEIKRLRKQSQRRKYYVKAVVNCEHCGQRIRHPQSQPPSDIATCGGSNDEGTPVVQHKLRKYYVRTTLDCVRCGTRVKLADVVDPEKPICVICREMVGP